jgi:hypothetical protein
LAVPRSIPISLENRLLNCANMNSPNRAQLIHYVPKGQAVNNFLMADGKCQKTPKNVTVSLAGGYGAGGGQDKNAVRRGGHGFGNRRRFRFHQTLSGFPAFSHCSGICRI